MANPPCLTLARKAGRDQYGGFTYPTFNWASVFGSQLPVGSLITVSLSATYITSSFTSVTTSAGWTAVGRTNLPSPVVGGPNMMSDCYYRIAVGSSADNLTITFGNAFWGSGSSGDGRWKNAIVNVWTGGDLANWSGFTKNNAAAPVGTYSPPAPTPSVFPSMAVTLIQRPDTTAVAAANGWTEPRGSGDHSTMMKMLADSGASTTPPSFTNSPASQYPLFGYTFSVPCLIDSIESSGAGWSFGPSWG